MSKYGTLLVSAQVLSGREGKVLGTIPSGERVEILSTKFDGWYMIRHVKSLLAAEVPPHLVEAEP
jgi:hypothetical protein